MPDGSARVGTVTDMHGCACAWGGGGGGEEG